MPRFVQSPAKIQTYLSDVTYPAQKSEIIDTARRNSAPSVVLKELMNIPEREYPQASEVLDAIETAAQP